MNKTATQNLPANLTSDRFRADPRVTEAKRLLLTALAQHQKTITGIRPADPQRKLSYDALISQWNQARGGNLFFPYLGAGIGNGPLVELADGSVKFDLISGIGVHHFGHSHPRLVEAGIDAALGDTVMQGNLQQNVESAKVAELLLQHAAKDSSLAHCFLTTSGAMANENALKLAFHKRPGTSRLMAFEHTFAGRTLALSSLTDKAAYRTGLPKALDVDYVPFFDSSRPAESIDRAVQAIRTHAARYPGQHAALWCELVLGEGGFYPGSAEFLEAVCKTAKASNLLVVADEVQTFGRTSELFAFQHFRLQRLVDIVTVGKMLQLCATLFTDTLKPAPGIVSQTFTASTSAILAAQAILEQLLSGEFFGPRGRNTQMHAQFTSRLDAIAARHTGWIRGPYGIGGMIAFTAFDGSDKLAKKLLQALFEAGVIAFYNGGAPTRIRFLPPVPVLTDNHINTVCTILEQTMQRVSEAQE
jgi:acetylornithine aminotransferase